MNTDAKEIEPFTPVDGWTEQQWEMLERGLSARIVAARSEKEAIRILSRGARRVLKTYSSSFFAVTRFLPTAKREQVEAIYAAVRYPDEIVDTFALDSDERRRRLREWRSYYECALGMGSLRESVALGIPCFVAGFVHVARAARIPDEHYRSFLDAMEMDARPRPFETLDDLIDTYIYGSATVVGYFLAHVYGAPTPSEFPRTLSAARSLGIALQLTNFVRDVAEDQRRGRQYLPVDMLRAEGIAEFDATDPAQHAGIARVRRGLAYSARMHYQQAADDLDAFAKDSRCAIRACIDVYGALNARIMNSNHGIMHRESIPLSHKFRVLPPSKYWRLPLAYLGW